MGGAILPFIMAFCCVMQPINEAGLPNEKSPECIELSIEDAQLMLGVAQSEAGNQGPDGAWLVMSVIWNRVQSEDYPDTVSEVVSAKKQFAAPADHEDVCPDVHLALARLESGDVCPEIIAFEGVQSNVLEKYARYAFTYKQHKFYTNKEK